MGRGAWLGPLPQIQIAAPPPVRLGLLSTAGAWWFRASMPTGRVPAACDLAAFHLVVLTTSFPSKRSWAAILLRKARAQCGPGGIARRCADRRVRIHEVDLGRAAGRRRPLLRPNGRFARMLPNSCWLRRSKARTRSRRLRKRRYTAGVFVSAARATARIVSALEPSFLHSFCAAFRMRFSRSGSGGRGILASRNILTAAHGGAKKYVYSVYIIL